MQLHIKLDAAGRESQTQHLWTGCLQNQKQIKPKNK